VSVVWFFVVFVVLWVLAYLIMLCFGRSMGFLVVSYKRVHWTHTSLERFKACTFPRLLWVQWCGDVGVQAGLVQNLPDTRSHFPVCQISQKWFQLKWIWQNRFWPEYWLDTRFYRFVVSGTGNNQQVSETASTLKTSNKKSCYNQPVPETNRQYWSCCNWEIFRKCD